MTSRSTWLRTLWLACTMMITMPAHTAACQALLRDNKSWKPILSRSGGSRMSDDSIQRIQLGPIGGSATKQQLADHDDGAADPIFK